MCEPAPSLLMAALAADCSPMQERRKARWFLSPTKAKALQMLPVETRFALLLWKPKLCLSQFPILINNNWRDQKNSCLGSWAMGAEVAPPSHKQRDPRPLRCCSSQPPLAREASETARSLRALCCLAQAEPPTPSLLQTEPLSSIHPSPS